MDVTLHGKYHKKYIPFKRASKKLLRHRIIEYLCNILHKYTEVNMILLNVRQ